MSKKDKKIFALIRENRFIIRVMASLGFAVSVNAANAPNSISETEKNIREEIIKNISAINVENEIDKRVDWFMHSSLDSLKVKYANFPKNNLRQKRQQVKKMMGVANGGKRFSGNENYCLAACISNIVSSDYGDAEDLLPNDGVTGGYCDGFVQYVKNQYGPQYAKKSTNLLKEIKNFKPGTIVIVDYGNRRHAITYDSLDNNGNPKIIGFNNEDNGLLKNYPNKGTIVDIRGIIKSKWQERLKDKNSSEALQDLYQNRLQEMDSLLRPSKIIPAEVFLQYAQKNRSI